MKYIYQVDLVGIAESILKWHKWEIIVVQAAAGTQWSYHYPGMVRSVI